MKEKLLIKIVFLIHHFLQKMRFFESEKKKKIYKFFFKNKTIDCGSNLQIDPKIGYIELDSKKCKIENSLIEKCIIDANKIFNLKNKSTGSKRYLRNILDHRNEVEIKNFLYFFLNDKILNIVRSYL